MYSAEYNLALKYETQYNAIEEYKTHEDDQKPAPDPVPPSNKVKDTVDSHSTLCDPNSNEDPKANVTSACDEMAPTTSALSVLKERLTEPAIISVTASSVHHPVPSILCVPSKTSISTVTNIDINSSPKSLPEMKQDILFLCAKYFRQLNTKRKSENQNIKRKQKKREKAAAIRLRNGSETVELTTEKKPLATTPQIKMLPFPKTIAQVPDNSLEDRKKCYC